MKETLTYEEFKEKMNQTLTFCGESGCTAEAEKFSREIDEMIQKYPEFDCRYNEELHAEIDTLYTLPNLDVKKFVINLLKKIKKN